MSGPAPDTRLQPPGGGRRVAFFGGSFDPPHLGHLAVARAARVALGLDAVLFAPVGSQPLKPHGSTASFEDRLAMTRLAIAGEPGFEISLADAPMPSGAPNFTLETLLGLRAQLPPGSALFCLMGADSFFALRFWHRAVEIPFAAPLIVASRPGQPLDDLQAALPGGLTMEPLPDADRPASGVELRAYLVANRAGEHTPFYLLPGLNVEISASGIRERIREQIRELVRAPAPVPAAGDTLLPAAVLDYIRSRGLYRQPPLTEPDLPLPG
jgi:nicotinate-nucleotide adenylyltransferase